MAHGHSLPWHILSEIKTSLLYSVPLAYVILLNICNQFAETNIFC